MDDFYNVRAEDCNPEEAAGFYITPRSHPEHLNEFYIVYYDSENKKHADPYLPHYLQRSVRTIFDGGASQPLTFGHYSPERDTPLTLYKPTAESAALSGSMTSIPHGIRSTLRRNRRRENMISVSLSSWIAEQPDAACVIQHSRQSLTSAPFIIAVVIPRPSQPDLEQEPQEQPETEIENEATPQREESEQVPRQQEDTREEAEEEIQESQEVHEAEDSQQGRGSLPGEQQETATSELPAAPGHLVHQVVWMESSDSKVGGAVKMFEIVPTQNN